MFFQTYNVDLFVSRHCGRLRYLLCLDCILLSLSSQISLYTILAFCWFFVLSLYNFVSICFKLCNWMLLLIPNYIEIRLRVQLQTMPLCECVCVRLCAFVCVCLCACARVRVYVLGCVCARPFYLLHCNTGEKNKFFERAFNVLWNRTTSFLRYVAKCNRVHRIVGAVGGTVHDCLRLFFASIHLETIETACQHWRR